MSYETMTLPKTVTQDEALSILRDILVKCPVNGYRGKYDYRKTYQARKRAREILARVDALHAQPGFTSEPIVKGGAA